MSAEPDVRRGWRGPPPLSVQITCLDHYMASPLPAMDDTVRAIDSQRIYKVPVLRVFGSTPEGQSTCLHIHKVYPYFYVRYEDAGSTLAQAKAFAAALANGLDRALSLRPGTADPAGGGSAADGDATGTTRAWVQQHVHSVQLVGARSIYGYQREEQAFVKVQFYNPRDIKRASELLQVGAVLQRCFQPFESHIPFLLQFKGDFNLFGMGFLRAEEVLFRSGLPCRRQEAKWNGWGAPPISLAYEASPEDPAYGLTAQKSPEEAFVWVERTVPSDWRWDSHDGPPRHSTCEIEADVEAELIMNRRELEGMRVPLEDVGENVRMVKSLAPMWAEELNRIGTIDRLPASTPPWGQEVDEWAPLRPPPSQPRAPQPLTDAAELRAALQEIVDAVERVQDSQTAPESQLQGAAASQETEAVAVPGSQAARWHLSQANDTSTAPEGIASAEASEAEAAAVALGDVGRETDTDELDQELIDEVAVLTQLAREKREASVRHDPENRAQLASQILQQASCQPPAGARGVGPLHDPQNGRANHLATEDETELWSLHQEFLESSQPQDLIEELLMAATQPSQAVRASQAAAVAVLTSQQEARAHVEGLAAAALETSQREVQDILDSQVGEEPMDVQDPRAGDTGGIPQVDGSGDKRSDGTGVPVGKRQKWRSFLPGAYRARGRGYGRVDAPIPAVDGAGDTPPKPSRRPRYGVLAVGPSEHSPVKGRAAAEPDPGGQARSDGEVRAAASSGHCDEVHASRGGVRGRARRLGRVTSGGKLGLLPSGLMAAPMMAATSPPSSKTSDALRPATSRPPQSRMLLAEGPSPGLPRGPTNRSAAARPLAFTATTAPSSSGDNGGRRRREPAGATAGAMAARTLSRQPGALGQRLTGGQLGLGASSPRCSVDLMMSRHQPPAHAAMGTTSLGPPQVPTEAAVSTAGRLIKGTIPLTDVTAKAATRISTVKEGSNVASVSRSRRDHQAVAASGGRLSATKGRESLAAGSGLSAVVGAAVLEAGRLRSAGGQQAQKAEEQPGEIKSAESGLAATVPASLDDGPSACDAKLMRGPSDDDDGALAETALSNTSGGGPAALAEPPIGPEDGQEGAAEHNREEGAKGDCEVGGGRAETQLSPPCSSSGDGTEALSENNNGGSHLDIGPESPLEVAMLKPSSLCNAEDRAEPSRDANATSSLSPLAAPSSGLTPEVSPRVDDGNQSLAVGPTPAPSRRETEAAGDGGSADFAHPLSLGSCGNDEAATPDAGQGELQAGALAAKVSDATVPTTRQLAVQHGTTGQQGPSSSSPPPSSAPVPANRHQQADSVMAGDRLLVEVDHVGVVYTSDEEEVPATQEVEGARSSGEGKGARHSEHPAMVVEGVTATFAERCSDDEEVLSLEGTEELEVDRPAPPQGPDNMEVDQASSSGAMGWTAGETSESVDGQAGQQDSGPTRCAVDVDAVANTAESRQLPAAGVEGLSDPAGSAAHCTAAVRAADGSGLASAAGKATCKPPSTAVEGHAVDPEVRPPGACGERDDGPIVGSPMSWAGGSDPESNEGLYDLGGWDAGLFDGTEDEELDVGSGKHQRRDVPDTDTVSPQGELLTAKTPTPPATHRIVAVLETPLIGPPQQGHAADVASAVPDSALRGPSTSTREKRPVTWALDLLGPSLGMSAACSNQPTDPRDPFRARLPQPRRLSMTSAALGSASQAAPGQMGTGGAEGQSVEDQLPLVALRPKELPPTPHELAASASGLGVPIMVHQIPFYSIPSDAPPQAVVIAGRRFSIPTAAVAELPNFAEGSQLSRSAGALPSVSVRASALRCLVPAWGPPSRAATEEWLEEKRGRRTHRLTLVPKGPSAMAFATDPNTGKIVPPSFARLASQAQSQDTGLALGVNLSSDLIDAPGATQDSLTSGTVSVRPPVAPRPSQGGDADQGRASKAGDQNDESDSDEADHREDGGESDEMAERPPSPKYDEPYFFIPKTARTPGRAKAAKRRRSSGRTPASAWPKPSPPVAANLAPVYATASDSAGFIGADGRAPESANKPYARRSASDITPPRARGSVTPVSQAGFRQAGPGAECNRQHITVCSVEIIADCSGTRLPDPRKDPVVGLVLVAAQEGAPADDALTRLLVLERPAATDLPNNGAHVGIPRGYSAGWGRGKLDWFQDEEALFRGLAHAIQALDPDIMVAYDNVRAGLGFLAERCAHAGFAPLIPRLSRTPEIANPRENWGRVEHPKKNESGDAEIAAGAANRPGGMGGSAPTIPGLPGSGASDMADGSMTGQGLLCVGRVTLNLWEVMRSEVKLNIYTFENCVHAVLQRRVPKVPLSQLALWAKGREAWRALSHQVSRARLVLQLMDQLDLVGRTAELARTYGIDFTSVMTRGSQYRVESLMSRLAHTQNYLLISPSKEQVARQPAMACLPLVMEPESCMYTDPVVVLDFQSLYPSMMIAYNLCFSTAVGKLSHCQPPQLADEQVPPRFGVTHLRHPPDLLLDEGLDPSDLVVTPNGFAFVPKSTRPGVLPRMLRELLATRIMVKSAMKRHPKSMKVLQRVLNARQFALKMISNVTYGYTSAGFSGRMPMAELADAIVSSGRDTLERAIRMVNEHPSWDARVVYGDTDSMFVLLEGRSREAAHQIGAEIAAAVTAANPPPVTLKMEKVYLPCVLQTKKRYVGFMYESPSQMVPDFDAKGIETVRRDGCPAVQKVLECTIRSLFTSRDLSQVRRYLERTWRKILSNRVSIQDFIFAKEVRLHSYRGPTQPPAAVVAAQMMSRDLRAEPARGERVPYCVVYGPPGARLVDMVLTPTELVESRGTKRLHAKYYITKQIIPAVDRILSLVGVDCRRWFDTMSRADRSLPQKRPLGALPVLQPSGGHSAVPGLNASAVAGGTIDSYYLSRHCAVCDGQTSMNRPVCESCFADPQATSSALSARAAALHTSLDRATQICRQCGGAGICVSLDCRLFFETKKLEYELDAASELAQAGLGSLEALDF